MIAAIAGPGADTGPGLLQDAATMLLAVAIDASPGRGDATASTTGVAVPMLLTAMLFLVEMLLQLHVAQSPVHHSDEVLMYLLVVVLQYRPQRRCYRQLTPT
ncbi:hypothetical protein X777_01807 [Ooceraea biroi]|uniref:Uncharacterized protein n=1 Tax=Ooceraea biroi TaxID=2015173 RepID=A0A026WNG8_OOCBI|nr:hypothetical protein X777_01807 [Ooceraea biroi]